MRIVNRKLITLLFAFVMSIMSIPVLSEPVSEQEEPLELRKIMQDLGKNMQAVTDAISREDWKQIEKIAPEIADHPQPPFLEKLRILSYVGSNVGKFKDYDGKTHDTAEALREVAATSKGMAVIAAFANLQATCFECHQEFRQAFLDHFYK